MARPTADPRWPPEVEYPDLRKAVEAVTPGDTPSEVRTALCQIPDGEAHKAIVETGEWEGPNGRIVTVPHANWPDMIVGYRKLRDKDWFVAKDGEVLYGPLKTKRHALHQVRAKKGEYVEAGWYRAAECDVFTRDMSEKVIGRRL